MTLPLLARASLLLFLLCGCLAPEISLADATENAPTQAQPESDDQVTEVAEAAEAETPPGESDESDPSPKPPENTEATGDAPDTEADTNTEADTDTEAATEVPSETPKTSPPSDDATSKTLALLRAVEKRHAGANTVRGTFQQTKISEIFLEEIESTGTFWYRKPEFFRCDYNQPDEMTNLIVEDKIYVFVPSIEQVEVYKFASPEERDQQLHSMVLGFGFEAEEILEQYEVQSSEDQASLLSELTLEKLDSAAVALFRFQPKGALIETSPFTSLKLWIDKETLLPQKIWFEDYNGDKTTLRIVQIELNVSIDDNLFSPSFPPGTEFIDKTEDF